MAEHIWSVLSEKAVIDSQSNLLSLFDVLEQIDLSGPGPKEYQKGSEILIPAKFTLTTLWVRSDIKKPEKIKTRVTTLAPDNKTLSSNEVEIDLTKHRRSRGIINSQSFLLKGPGIYKFKIDVETKKGESKIWRNVANIPLEVTFNFSPVKPTKKKIKRKP